MKNDFRQLVDRNLSGLRWDGQRQARVLASLEPKGGTTMKRKLTMALALALAMLMLASVAVAAVVLTYSPGASVLKQARDAVVDKYGLTYETLGLFDHSLYLMENESTVIFHSNVVDAQGNTLTGEYTVTIPDEGALAVSWTFDGVAPSVWQTGDMDSPVWGQPQLERYLKDKEKGEEAMYFAAEDDGNVTYEVGVTPVPSAEVEIVEVVISKVEPGPNDLTREEAIALAGAALMDSFALTEEQIAMTDFFFCELEQLGEYATRTWRIHACYAQEDIDMGMYVLIDASTGEIIDIDLTTGGNG